MCVKTYVFDSCSFLMLPMHKARERREAGGNLCRAFFWFACVLMCWQLTDLFLCLRAAERMCCID